MCVYVDNNQDSNNTEDFRHDVSEQEYINAFNLSTLIVGAGIVFTFTILAVVLAIYLDRKRRYTRRTNPMCMQTRILKCGCRMVVYDERRKSIKKKTKQPKRSTEDVKTLPIVEFSRTRRPVIAPSDLADVIYETLDSKDVRRKNRLRQGKRTENADVEFLPSAVPDSAIPESSSQSSNVESVISQYDNPPCIIPCKFCRSHSVPDPAVSSKEVPSEYFQLELPNSSAEREPSNSCREDKTINDNKIVVKKDNRSLRHTQSVILHDRLPPLPPMRCPPRIQHGRQRNFPLPRRSSYTEGAHPIAVKNEYFAIADEKSTSDYSKVRKSSLKNEETSARNHGDATAYFVLEDVRTPSLTTIDSDIHAQRQHEYAVVGQGRSDQQVGNVHEDFFERVAPRDRVWRTSNSEGVTVVFLNKPETTHTCTNLDEGDDGTYERIRFESSDELSRKRLNSAPH